MANRLSMGVSYAPDIKKLNTTFDVKKGDLVTHEQIATVIGARYGSPRHRGVIYAWRKHLYRTNRLNSSGEGRARGVGVAFLTDSESNDSLPIDVNKIRRGARRSSAKADAIDPTNFTTNYEHERYNINRRELHNLHVASQAATKIMAGPKPMEPR